MNWKAVAGQASSQKKAVAGDKSVAIDLLSQRSSNSDSKEYLDASCSYRFEF